MTTVCPYCGYLANQHETLNRETEFTNKDISFCINCGEVSQFENLELKKVDVETLDSGTKAEIKRIEIAWLQTRNLRMKS